MGSKISEISFSFPKNKITNENLQKEFPDYNFSKFEKKVGIVNRYVVDQGGTALGLAIEACEKLLHVIDKDNIDFLLYCTQSPEHFLPTTACLLAKRLNLSTRIGALDFNLGCSGFTYGLSLAKGIIESGQAKNVLLVTAETYSKYINPKDKSNRAIFGDAASATLISFSECNNISQILFGTNGGGAENLIVKNGCAYPYDPKASEITYGTDNIYTDNDLYMNGPEIFRFTTEEIPNFVLSILKNQNLEINDVDQYIFHQANSFLLNQIRIQLNIPKDKFYVNLADGGNTVSSTIPIALKRYLDQNKSSSPRKIMLVGFGVGLSWSGGIITL
jgi:3-oxoacyl-[acyl-carrier-protein] synthase III